MLPHPLKKPSLRTAAAMLLAAATLVASAAPATAAPGYNNRKCPAAPDKYKHDACEDYVANYVGSGKPWKYVRVRVHFILDAFGQGNFASDGHIFAADIVDEANDRLRNLQRQNKVGLFKSKPEALDPHIQWVLTGVEYHNDDDYHSVTDDTHESALNHLRTEYGAEDSDIDVFIVTKPGATYISGYATGYTYTWDTLSCTDTPTNQDHWQLSGYNGGRDGIIIAGLADMHSTPTWLTDAANVFNHELGHVLGLHHITNHYDEVLIDTPREIRTNNLMHMKGRETTMDALTPCQLQTMHMVLEERLSHYVVETPAPNSPSVLAVLDRLPAANSVSGAYSWDDSQHRWSVSRVSGGNHTLLDGPYPSASNWPWTQGPAGDLDFVDLFRAQTGQEPGQGTYEVTLEVRSGTTVSRATIWLELELPPLAVLARHAASFPLTGPIVLDGTPSQNDVAHHWVVCPTGVSFCKHQPDGFSSGWMSGPAGAVDLKALALQRGKNLGNKTYTVKLSVEGSDGTTHPTTGQITLY